MAFLLEKVDFFWLVDFSWANGYQVLEAKIMEFNFQNLLFATLKMIFNLITLSKLCLMQACPDTTCLFHSNVFTFHCQHFSGKSSYTKQAPAYIMIYVTNLC